MSNVNAIDQRQHGHRDQPRGSSPRVVLLGMVCDASNATIQRLLAAGIKIQAIVLADQGNRPPVWPGTSIQTVAIPRRGELEARIAPFQPDLIVVACFPWRLPQDLLGLPRFGCVNVHPSLLPIGRGPEPVFWTLRRGERQTGATIHRIDEGLDTGPILAQATTPVPLGIEEPALEHHLMSMGGTLLAETLPAIASGTASGTPQGDTLATTAPPPTREDFIVPTNLPARWAYGFACGVAWRSGPLTLDVAATRQRYQVARAIDYDDDGILPASVVDQGGGIVRVQFRPGTARFLVRPVPG